jgi:hypothetical protein
MVSLQLRPPLRLIPPLIISPPVTFPITSDPDGGVGSCSGPGGCHAPHGHGPSSGVHRRDGPAVQGRAERGHASHGAPSLPQPHRCRRCRAGSNRVREVSIVVVDQSCMESFRSESLKDDAHRCFYFAGKC